MVAFTTVAFNPFSNNNSIVPYYDSQQTQLLPTRNMENPQQFLQRFLPPHLVFPGAKTALTVFAFSLNGISGVGRAIIDQAIDHPWLFGITAALIIGGILFLILPAIIGFGPLGPIEGTSLTFMYSYTR